MAVRARIEISCSRSAAFLALALFIWMAAFQGVSKAQEAVEESTVVHLPTLTVYGHWLTLPEVYPGGQVASGSQIGFLGYKTFMDTPFSVTSYTAENIENKQAKTLSDLFRDDPTVRFQYPSGAFMDNLYIRNMGYNLNNLTLNGMMSMAPIATVPIEFLERVEIQRGPTAFTHGITTSNEVSGSINLVTKRAQLEDTTRLTLDYTSDLNLGGHLDVGRRFGDDKQFGVRFNGVYRDGDKGVKDQSVTRQLASLGLDYDNGSLQIALDGYYIKDEFDGAGTFMVNVRNLTALPSIPDNSNSLKGLYGEVENKGVTLRADWQINDYISAYAGVGRAEGNYTGFVGGGDITLTSLAGVGNANLINYNTFIDRTSAEAGLRANFQTGPVKHSIVVGAARQVIDVGSTYNYRAYTGLNIYDPVFDSSTLPGTPSRPKKSQQFTFDSLAFSDTLSVNDDMVQLTVGGRRQSVQLETFNATTGKRTSLYDQAATSPAFGLVVKPWGDLISFYGSYIEGLSRGQIVGASYANAGEILKPYKSKQYEMGVKWNTGVFANTLSFFRLHRANQIVRDNVFSYDGEQRNQGIEWTTFGEVAEGTRLLGGLVYSETEITSATNGVNQGNEAFGSPRWQGNLGIEWDTIWNRELTLTARAVYTGSMYANNTNTIKLPSATTFDAGARYKTLIRETPVIFRASVENVFDKDYWGSRGDNGLYIGAGRTFKLSATIDF